MCKRKCFIIFLFIFFFPLTFIHAKNTENLIDLDFDYNFNTFDKSSNFSFNFYKQNSFLKFFSYSPFVSLNFNSFSMAGSKLSSNLNDFNHWADDIVNNTILLNWLMLGTPYIIMGVYDVLTCPYLIDYGIIFDFHPYVNPYIDSKFGIGIENSPYQVLKYDQSVEWLRPFGIFRAEVDGHYKILKASLSFGYYYDISCKIRDEQDLSYWNIGLTIGINLGRNSPASKIDQYFIETPSYDEEYIADFTI